MHKIRFIVLLVALCCVLIAGAQSGISVKVFSELTQDLDARVNYPETDQNGQKCALVKVVTTESDFSFDNGQLGVTKAIHNPELSEWWVYLPAKTMKLKIMHPVLGQLKDSEDGFYYFPTPLKEATCYRMELTTGKVRVTVEEERVKTGYLVINSVPEHAHVYITEGGIENYAGTTPFYKKMPYGTYNYRVKKSLYHDNVGVAVINNTRIIHDLALQPAFGSLSVTSSPSGATVTIENDLREFTTPCVIDQLPSGTHRVNIVSSRYTSFSREIEIKDGQQTELVATLDARFAIVSINTLPEAIITINGQVKGKGNYSEELGEGIYDIEVSLDKHRTVTRQIEVVSNQPQTLTLEPIPISGSLDIESQPMFANVIINGQNYGDTPLSIENLLVGDYEVVLSKQGYVMETRHVSITENTLSIIEANLSQGNTIPSDANMIEDDSKSDKINGLQPLWNSSITNVQRSILQKLCNNMVYIKGGRFTMGATTEQDGDVFSNEIPSHKVTISDFMIANTEVTQELWDAVMGSNPSRFRGEDLPVESVSWDDCQEFIKKLNYLTGLNFRLPTEAEWEYAARGGNKSKGYKFSGSNVIENVAYYFGNSSSRTHTVASKSSNELGLYDMSGNVYEWCSDWYGDYTSNSQVNPQGPSSGSHRVIRGGSWSFKARYCRISDRYLYIPNNSNYNLGFRLAISVK
ncbi:MAG: SUMF1/EgtB/PvdO family nonheme iron enzyme [Muribaculaceae bacterium]|nr:SUMF1/EgtB/PvdO family nonheme iron enzyme [Muribaculaceae bacterium]